MIVRQGDIFCLTHESTIQSGIIAGSRILSIDNSANYGHAGIITDSDGSTFEALARYSHGNIYEYSGCDILIGRHVEMTPERHQRGMAAVKYLDGRLYPFLRFIVWSLPYNMAKYIHPFKKPVCSELVFMYGTMAGLRDINYWWGVSPDYVADAIKRWDVFDVIYEGRI